MHRRTLHPRTSWNLTVTGWALFTVSAICFSIEAARTGSVIGLVASLCFLVACGVFMVPVLSDRPRDR